MQELVSPVIVALLWGTTTPFLREGSRGIHAVASQGQSWWQQHLLEIGFLLRWQYVVPFLLNQWGSVLFIRALSSDQLSIVVPLVNSLTFVVVFLTDVVTGKSFFSRRSIAGLILILIGIAVCLMGSKR